MQAQRMFTVIMLILIFLMVGIPAICFSEGKYKNVLHGLPKEKKPFFLDQEECPDTVLRYDKVVEGRLRDIFLGSKRIVIWVGYRKYRLCHHVLIFNSQDQPVGLKQLGGAIYIKAFFDIKRRCIRKIKIIKARE